MRGSTNRSRRLKLPQRKDRVKKELLARNYADDKATQEAVNLAVQWSSGATLSDIVSSAEYILNEMPREVDFLVSCGFNNRIQNTKCLLATGSMNAAVAALASKWPLLLRTQVAERVRMFLQRRRTLNCTLQEGCKSVSNDADVQRGVAKTAGNFFDDGQDKSASVDVECRGVEERQSEEGPALRFNRGEVAEVREWLPIIVASTHGDKTLTLFCPLLDVESLPWCPPVSVH